MKFRKAWGWRAAAIAGALGVSAWVLPSCLKKAEGPESQVAASEVGTVQTVIRVFRKLIGRDPGAAEINALKALTYKDLVAAVLNSQQFDQEGFYNLHRERLLLNREGTENWVKNSYDDYCSLRLEMSEVAGKDRNGGYWQTLKYDERWLAVGNEGMNSCFFGTDIASLIKAADLPEGTGNATPGSREQMAGDCIDNLRYQLPGPGQAQAKFKAFVDKLKALPEDQKKLSLLATADGEELFLTSAKRNIFPEYAQFPATATQPKNMKLELVKKDGKPIVLQELGTQGNQQCLFANLDPVDYTPKPDEPEEGGGGGGVIPFQPPPIDFPTPVGIPEQPTLFPAPAAATTAAVQAQLAKADGTIFMKFKLPKEYVGVHANPYWLSRHPSKEKNRNLHRARVVYFSYFCTDINPDAANFSGAPVTEFPENLKPYFAADDNHVKGSQNCFNCHTKVQPIANFFGLASWGSNYDQGGGGFGGFKQWPEFINRQGAFDRPGAIYDGATFFDAGGETKGLGGLAAHLSKYPQVRSCMAEATWAALVGRDFPLWDTERAAAIKAFEGTNQKASLNRLLKHYLTDSKRGETFFAKGETEFAKLKPNEAFVCPETLTPDIETKAHATMGNACVTCHEGEFITADKKFDFEQYFTTAQMAEDTPEERGLLWHKLFCKVKLEKMPPAGSGVQLDAATRGNAWCYLGRTRDKLAAEGKIPAAYKDKVCQGAPPASSALVHTIVGTPP